MDAMQAFFQRYGAVPADGRGPRYDEATEDALLTHLAGLAHARRRQLRHGRPDNHADAAAARADLTAVAAELWRRLPGLYERVRAGGTDAPERDTLGRSLARLAEHADVLALAGR